MRSATRLGLVFTVGLLGGLALETLLMTQSQAQGIERTLRADFKLLIFLKNDLSEARRKVFEEKLLALPDVEEARYVSRENSLALLRREDPELAESVALLGENPLPPAYEARLTADGIGRVSQWIDKAYSLGEVEEIRYKQRQVHAILQAEFYRHFLSLILNIIVSLTAILGVLALWLRGWARFHAEAFKSSAAMMGGILCAVGLASLLAYPMRHLYSWGGPPLLSQALLILCGGAIGLCLPRWNFRD